jgi:anti-sigma factor RsiW
MTLSLEDDLLLNAYLDGELDPIEAARFERRLVADAALNARVETLRTLRAALRYDLAEDVPSPELRRRIMNDLNLAPRAHTNSWFALAASFLIGAVLAGATTFGALNYQAGHDVAEEIVSAHIRALMAPQPTDVASSDHHTVKPWFNGKLAFAPTVVDLSTKGFPLVGGRIDVVRAAPVASLVYSHGKHLISLTEMPNTRGEPAPLTSHLEKGYLALSWSDGGVIYWAVSDAARNELENFAALFRAATAATYSGTGR